MTYRSAWLVGLLLVARMLLASPAHAQGAMSDSWTDNNGDIYTEVFSTEVQYCPTSYVWSDLVGADGTQYSGSDVIQWVTSASPGTDYTWYFGGTIYAPDPYGTCQAYQWSATITIKIANTYRAYTGHSGSTCYYGSLACTFGTPTCPNIPPTTLYVWPSCPPYLHAFWLVENGNTCFNVATVGALANGACD